MVDLVMDLTMDMAIFILLVVAVGALELLDQTELEHLLVRFLVVKEATVVLHQ
jgi:hypothetical protein